jgi:hypothetical protein
MWRKYGTWLSVDGLMQEVINEPLIRPIRRYSQSEQVGNFEEDKERDICYTFSRNEDEAGTRRTPTPGL